MLQRKAYRRVLATAFFIRITLPPGRVALFGRLRMADVGTPLGVGLIVFASAGLAALIARAKGHVPALWFVLGLLFPVVALTVITLLPRRPQTVRGR